MNYPPKAYAYATGYVASVVAANLTLHYFITLPVLGVFTFGTLFFAFTFTFRDRLHHLSNRRFVYATIGACVIANIIATPTIMSRIRIAQNADSGFPISVGCCATIKVKVMEIIITRETSKRTMSLCGNIATI